KTESGHKSSQNLRLATCDFVAVFFDEAIIATSSLASLSSSRPFRSSKSDESMIKSSQNADSSASSSTVPSLPINSAFDRARQAARGRNRSPTSHQLPGN